MKRIVLGVAVVAGLMTASCNNTANREMEAKLQAQAQTIAEMKVAMDRQHLIDSMSQVAVVQQEAEAAKPKATTVVYRAPRKKSSANRVNSYAATRPVENNYQEAPVYQTAAQQPQVVYQPAEQQQPQKKGWSAKAKGAVIGAGVGALGGALIGKKKGTGALIGAGVGALAGLGTGAIIDKRNGR